MKDAVQAVVIEVTCPRHGRVLAEVSRRTSAAGPPCPDCGSACTIYAPMLALASACAAVAPPLGRSKLLDLGVKHVSISGSKGKRITPEEDWNSPHYADLRRLRSAVESLMFTTKFHFDFGQFHRRGQQAVREEALEKAIAHNFWRMALQRSRLAAHA